MAGGAFDVAAAIEWFGTNVTKANAHGSNLLGQLRKYRSLKPNQQASLPAIVRAYQDWFAVNQELHGYTRDVISDRVGALDRYKQAIENAPFSPQSKLLPSVLEEFLFYLFRDLLAELNAAALEQAESGHPIQIGGTRAYSNLYFAPENFRAFTSSAGMRINEKDQDFAIYRQVRIEADGESRTINVPVLSVECKTYIDKTMLEGSIATAEKIKMGNPHSIFLVVTEWYDVSYEVDPKFSRIDQIYVLRRAKRRGATPSPICVDVVIDLFEFVRSHLERDWSRVEEKMQLEGKII